jgi:MerR family transcriptional regulator, thiopeptide resistance regulator
VDGRRWKVGELAAATGVTVRTLHHFDEIGLLRPAVRSPVGHRLYTEDDVRRLSRILALRDLEIPLGEIAGLLVGDAGALERLVRDRLDEVERHFESRQRLRRRLVALLAAARDAAEPSIDELIEAMEAMMQASYFTPDQLARLRERHREAGAGGFARWQQEWTAIVAELRGHLDRGADVAEPAVQETARRWAALMAHMTGGDPEILSAMYASLDGKGPEAATRGVVTADVWEYVKRAFAVGFGGATG